MPTVDETEKRLLTIRQRIEQLKLWNKTQEGRLKQRKYCDADSLSRSSQYIQRSRPNDYVLVGNKVNESVVEQPLKPDHTDFKLLLDIKLKEQESRPQVVPAPNIEKRRYLKKGEGGIAHSTRKTGFPLTTNTVGKIKSVSKNKTKYVESDDNQELLPPKKEILPLQAFESLERHLSESSFCSTSSMVAQLMEDSIKSTPIKPPSQDYFVVKPENLLAPNIYGERNIFGSGMLNVIHEEQSKDGSAIEKDQMGDKNVYFPDETCSDGDSECSSQCSCRQENNYTSKSISLIAEETTTVFSPAKSESKRTVRFIRQDDVQFDRSDYVDSNVQNKEEENLKYLMQTRLCELETEVDAFRSENEHLTKLRADYEQEYRKFCEEKSQLLTNIRAEQLQGARHIEVEKRKLQRDRNEFEKYVKEKKFRPTKQEKEEIRLLKEEIAFLKEEMKKKETRSAAAQASIRTELKRLRDRNEQLEEAIKQLKEKAEKAKDAPSILKQKKKSVYGSWRNVKTKDIKSPKQSCNEIVDVLNNLEFSDSLYIEKIRSYAENYETRPSPSSFDELRKSICINSFTNDVSVVEGNTNGHVNSADSIVSELYNTNGSFEKLFSDGRKEIWYPNGNVKKITPDGRLIKTIYYNGDVKEVLTEDQIVKYFYAESKVWHSEYKDGLEIIEFPSGQIEKRHSNGLIDIMYPNGNTFHKLPNDEEKWTYVDGTIITNNKAKNEKRILFLNGQTEIHTPEFKRREYPDGTIKTIYIDGRQETRYWNGRVRLKTKDGHLISDTDVTRNKFTIISDDDDK